MAIVQFLVAVSLLFSQVLADSGCNDCIRNGAVWCKELAFEDNRCLYTQYDNVCSGQTEKLPFFQETEKNGGIFSPVLYEETVYIGVSVVEATKDITFKYNTSDPQIHVNTDRAGLKAIVLPPKCNKVTCTATVKTSIHHNFCTSNSTTYEYGYVHLTVDTIDEIAVLKYHVPCACECTTKGVINSTVCNHHGDLECGACLCYNGWSGQFCDKTKCRSRGDNPMCSASSVNPCHGNGFCNECEECVCFRGREGSQYFDQSLECKDLCMVTNEYDTCLRNGSLGACPDGVHRVTIEKYNETLTATKNSQGFKDWVSCSVNLDDCYMEYYAMKTDHTRVMIPQSCNDKIAIARDSTAQAPMIMGILFGVAVVVAAAGFMLWKHLNAIPPLPVNDGGYSNIDAEDCVGENPLYKSPTSSFKNPTYGKW